MSIEGDKAVSPTEVMRAAFAEAFDAAGAVVASFENAVCTAVRSLVAHHIESLLSTEGGGGLLTPLEVSEILGDAHTVISWGAKTALERCAAPEGSAARGELRLGVTRLEAACQAVIAAVSDSVAQPFTSRREQLQSVLGSSRQAGLSSPLRRGMQRRQSSSVNFRTGGEMAPFVTSESSGEKNTSGEAADRDPAPPPLAVLGPIASSKYSLKASQEFVVGRTGAKEGQWSHVRSKVAAHIRPTTARGDPTSEVERRLHQVTTHIGSTVFQSAWDAADRDASIIDRRSLTPTRDKHHSEALLRNLPADRRDYIMYQIALGKMPPSAVTRMSRPAPGGDDGTRDQHTSSWDPRQVDAAPDIKAEMASFSSAPRTAAAANATKGNEGVAHQWTTATPRGAFLLRRHRTEPVQPTTHSRPLRPSSAAAEPTLVTRDASTPFHAYVSNVRRSERRPVSAAVKDLSAAIRSGEAVTVSMTSLARPSQ